MIIQKTDFTDQLNYSKYFPHFGNELLAGIAILLMFLIGMFAAILIYKNKMSNKIKIVLLSISLLCGGILFGGFPNIIFLTGLTFLILGISLLFGRIFCGYICPLGAGQELASIIRFKMNLFLQDDNDQRNILVQNVVRWSFFCGFVILILLFGFEILTPLNPLNGFLFIWFPLNLMFLVALVLLSVVMLSSIFFYRPFCRYICPFGAIMSLIGRFSIIKIRHTDACLECGLCEKICPTHQDFRKKNRGECYLCSRCMNFCSNEMCIDPLKIAQINRYLSTFALNYNSSSQEKFLDMILKKVVQLFKPKKRWCKFNEFIDALEGKKKVSIKSIQNIAVRIREMFPDEIQNIKRNKYETWIRNHESNWKEKILPIHLEKLTYGLGK